MNKLEPPTAVVTEAAAAPFALLMFGAYICNNIENTSKNANGILYKFIDSTLYID